MSKTLWHSYQYSYDAYGNPLETSVLLTNETCYINFDQIVEMAKVDSEALESLIESTLKTEDQKNFACVIANQKIYYRLTTAEYFVKQLGRDGALNSFREWHYSLEKKGLASKSKVLNQFVFLAFVLLLPFIFLSGEHKKYEALASTLSMLSVFFTFLAMDSFMMFTFISLTMVVLISAIFFKASIIPAVPLLALIIVGAFKARPYKFFSKDIVNGEKDTIGKGYTEIRKEIWEGFKKIE